MAGVAGRLETEPAAPPAASGPDLHRVIGFWGGLALIVGITIGSGVFRKPYTLARDVGDPAVILGAVGRLRAGQHVRCPGHGRARLHAPAHGRRVRLPARGLRRLGGLRLRLALPAGHDAGDHRRAVHVLRGAAAGPRGRATSRQAGPWSRADRGRRSPSSCSPRSTSWARAWAPRCRDRLTVVKVAALLVLMLVSFTMPRRQLRAPGLDAAARPTWAAAPHRSIWAYDGWIAVSMIAGEVRAPERQMRRIIVVGHAHHRAPLRRRQRRLLLRDAARRHGAGGGRRPAEDHGRDRLGPLGATFIAAAILCSVFGALNGNVLAKPRVAYALARDGLTFSFLGRTHPRWATPHAALLIQAAVALIAGGPAARLRPAHDLLRGGRVVRAAVRRRRGPRAAPAQAGCAASVPHAGLPASCRSCSWPARSAGLIAIVWGEIDQATPNYAPVLGLLLAAAGFPVFHAWRRANGGAPSTRR